MGDPSDDTRGFFDPNTEENLTYLELMERCVTDKDTGLRLLPFMQMPVKHASKVSSKMLFESESKAEVYMKDIIAAELVDKTTAEKMSILEATKCSLIRRGTAFELLEAQAASGKIIDVQSGKSISLETAFNTNVIDREYEDVVRRAYRAVIGYREPFKRQVLSLCEAMSRHLVFEKHAIRLLEAQLATGGIVDIKSPVRISADVAAKRGLLDSTLADKLGSKQTKSYFDPVTGENLNYSELMGRCVLDRDSNLLFLMVEGGTVTGNIRPYEPEPESKRIREEEQLANVRLKVVKAKRKKK